MKYNNASAYKYLVYYYNPWVMSKKFFDTKQEALVEYNSITPGYPKILYYMMEVLASDGAERAVGKLIYAGSVEPSDDFLPPVVEEA